MKKTYKKSDFKVGQKIYSQDDGNITPHIIEKVGNINLYLQNTKVVVDLKILKSKDTKYFICEHDIFRYKEKTRIITFIKESTNNLDLMENISFDNLKIIKTILEL